MAVDPFVGMAIAAVCACLLNAIAIDHVRRRVRAQDIALDQIACEQGIRVEVWPDGSYDSYVPDDHGLDIGGYTYHNSNKVKVNP